MPLSSHRWARSAVLAAGVVPLLAFGVLDGGPAPRPFGPASALERHSGLVRRATDGWEPMSADTTVVVNHFPDVLQIELVRGSEAPRFDGVQSARSYDFTGQGWHLKFDVSRLRMQYGLEAKFRVTRNHQTDYISMEVAEGRWLRFLHKFGGQILRDSIAFDPRSHVWFRLRHEAKDDTMRWETSRDGRSWTEQWRDVRRFDLGRVKAEVYAGTFEALRDPGSVRFSDFSVIDEPR